MSGVNKVILLGRLGKDPEVRTLESGKMVANFTLATSEVYKDRTTGEKKEITDWHNIVIWGKGAEVASKYLKKGDQVYVEGKMRTRSWEKDNITRYTTEVIVDNLNLIGNRNGSSNGSNSSGQNHMPAPQEPEFVGSNNSTDDLPF